MTWFDGPAGPAGPAAAGAGSAGVVELAADDARFPPRLLELESCDGFDAVARLFARGALVGDTPRWRAASEAPAVAIVGSRRATRAGADLARALAADLAAAGVVVVSGLALGIDAAAHAGALAARGTTFAVLGGSVLDAEPQSNRALAGRIAAEGGAILSEDGPGVEAAAWKFPRRNRLVAALADAVVVIEARERSGTTHTIDAALALGRVVCALPGPAGSPAHAGCHRAIREGAFLVESAVDVLDALSLDPGALFPADRATRSLPDVPFAADVVAQLDGGPLSPDALADAVGAPPGELLVAITELELAGLLRLDPGPVYRAAVRR